MDPVATAEAIPSLISPPPGDPGDGEAGSRPAGEGEAGSRPAGEGEAGSRPAGEGEAGSRPAGEGEARGGPAGEGEARGGPATAGEAVGRPWEDELEPLEELVEAHRPGGAVGGESAYKEDPTTIPKIVLDFGGSKTPAAAPVPADDPGLRRMINILAGFIASILLFGLLAWLFFK